MPRLQQPFDAIMAAITNSNIPSEQEDSNTEIKSLRIERDALRKDLSTAQAEALAAEYANP